MEQSKTDRLKRHIQDAIRNGEFPPGSTLPSVKQLCARYGVSKHTVSQALSNLNEQRIIEVSHGRKTRVLMPEKRIRLVHCGHGGPDFSTFWQPFFNGILKELDRHPGFQLTVEPLRVRTETPEKLPPCQSVVSMGTDSDILLRTLPEGTPAIFVYDYPETTPCSCVSSDFIPAFRELAELLRGRRSIAVFNQFEKNETHGINLQKLRLCREIMREAGLRVHDVYRKTCEDPMTAGYRMLLSLRDAPPDAVLLGTDDMAVGIYRAAHELGLRIPDDLAVCGCNNLPVADFLLPSLTSIALDAEAQGETALRMLIEHPEAPAVRTLFPARLVRRESL